MISFTNAIDIIKTAITMADKTKDLDFKKKILDLQEYIADLRSKNLELKELNRELNQDLLEKQSYNMVFNDVIYIDTAPDGTEKGKYCPTCWDSDSKAIRVHESKSFSESAYDCKQCKNYFRHKDVETSKVVKVIGDDI